ncbi:MAG: hypothetical protein J0I07_33525 [Myxococcales bacterium]|nr:hypothetical protein [Myxococcales bacterium]
MEIAGLPRDATVETPEGFPLEREAGTDSVLIPVDDPPRVLRITSRFIDKQVPVKRFVGAGWILLDIAMGGLIAIVIDAATGNWYEFEDTSMAAARPSKRTQRSVESADR